MAQASAQQLKGGIPNTSLEVLKNHMDVAPWGCGSVVALAVLREWLDLMVSEGFSNLLKDFMAPCRTDTAQGPGPTHGFPG